MRSSWCTIAADLTQKEPRTLVRVWLGVCRCAGVQVCYVLVADNDGSKLFVSLFFAISCVGRHLVPLVGAHGQRQRT